MKTNLFALTMALCALCPGPAALAAAASAGQQEEITALKSRLQASQAALRNYEWLETTVVSRNDEQKVRRQATRCYDVYGELQKVEIAASAESRSGGPPGRRYIAPTMFRKAPWCS